MRLFNENLEKVRDLVLEEMAMMMVEHCEWREDLFLAEHGFYIVVVRYTGVFDGTLTVIAQEPFADLLPKNLLGLMPDHQVTEADRLDAMKELTNVISGNFLVDAFGEETVFDLPHFEVGKCSFEEGTELLGENFVYCLADDTPLGVNFEIKVYQDAD